MLRCHKFVTDIVTDLSQILSQICHRYCHRFVTDMGPEQVAHIAKDYHPLSIMAAGKIS